MKKTKFWKVVGAILVTVVTAACNGPSSEAPNASSDQTPTHSASDKSIVLSQNSSASIELDAKASNKIVIVKQPAHGLLRIKNNIVTYRAIHPLYSGPDNFTYKIVKGTKTSNVAKVSIMLTPLDSGTTNHIENYAGQKYSLTGWKSFSSSAGQTDSSVVEFRTGTYNGVLQDTRRFGLYGDLNSYAGDARYTSLFGVLPLDGAAGAMHDWSWKAELIHLPECGVDTTITFKLVPNGGKIPIVAILLNYDIEKRADNFYSLTGYQLLLNGGGGSLTLSRFNNVHELATSYLDRWPNSNYGNEAFTNPVEAGPYKGWNYRNGVWPAGGNVGVGGSILAGVRYQYDSRSGNTTISYEARPPDGSDLTPGVWDEVIHLNGADSLTPGGSFGLMPLNYHTSHNILDTDFDVAEYKLVCALP